MPTLLFRTSVITVGLILCVIAGWIAGEFVGKAGEFAGLPLAPLVVTAILAHLFAVGLRSCFEWKPSHMLLGLIPTQLLLAFGINFLVHGGAFQGFDWSSLEWFFEAELHWLFWLNMFIGLPWVLGIFVGSFFLLTGTASQPRP